ncbi:uncharacterized protein LOC114287494 [Camellia sinensis]|uniref:uncharacterized protein LOC114287494 n=1 Tax=Camellia sinensis TaxID=4442 RepID=UPI001035F3BF|nr:uncharacterized protein LOC114287494 [Camellia sinensis]
MKYICWGAVEVYVCVVMKILSWNIKGQGKKMKQSKLKKLFQKRNVDMVLLQETKKSEISKVEIKSMWVRDKVELLAVDSEGSAGGLLCVWDLDVFPISESCSNKRFLLLSGTFFHSFECVILNIYAPNDVGLRGKLWKCLVKLKEEFPKPLCMGGDFNEIRNIGERKGCSRRDKGMRELNGFIDKCEVSDLPLLGRKYTWCNSCEGEKWSRIDRVLVDPKWLESFKLKLWGLPRLLSDHSPLLLIEDERDWGPKPFRVQNAWFLHKNLHYFWENSWKEARIEGWAWFILLNKLKTLKAGLKKWNVEVFGNVINNLKAAESELHNFDLVAKNRDLDESEKTRRREVRGEVWRLSKMVERLWFQKSRLNWALNGDKNTRFFHVMTKCRQMRNEINSITEGEVMYEVPCQVKKRVFEFFKTHFSEDRVERPELGGSFKSVQGCCGFERLEEVFSEAEIKSAVMDCDGKKAPGPYGFNMGVFPEILECDKE